MARGKMANIYWMYVYYVHWLNSATYSVWTKTNSFPMQIVFRFTYPIIKCFNDFCGFVFGRRSRAQTCAAAASVEKKKKIILYLIIEEREKEQQKWHTVRVTVWFPFLSIAWFFFFYLVKEFVALMIIGFGMTPILIFLTHKVIHLIFRIKSPQKLPPTDGTVLFRGRDSNEKKATNEI